MTKEEAIKWVSSHINEKIECWKDYEVESRFSEVRMFIRITCETVKSKEIWGLCLVLILNVFGM